QLKEKVKVPIKSIELELNGLNCASCASKIEKLSSEISGVSAANLDIITKKLIVELRDKDKLSAIKEEIKRIVNKLEPDVIIIDKNEQVEANMEGHAQRKGNKEEIIKLIIAGILFSLPFFLSLSGLPRLMIYIISYLLVGYKVVKKAVIN